MPGLVRKLFICAAVDGLLLLPGEKNVSQNGIKIEYGTHKIGPILKSQDDADSGRLEAHGIIGLLDLVSTSYLISITRREQVAQIRGHPIYSIKDVALIPLSSRAEAERAITAAQKITNEGSPGKRATASLTNAAEHTEESDVGEDVETSTQGDTDEQPIKGPEATATALEPPKSALQKSTTYVKNVVQDKGKYGRFADRWFSRGFAKAPAESEADALAEVPPKKEGLTVEQQRQAVQDLPSDDPSTKASQVTETAIDKHSDAGPATAKAKSVIQNLTPRILRSARLYFSSSGFYFSYDRDLSRRFVDQEQEKSSMPLWRRFDSLFFWNRHLLMPLIESGQDSFVLPVIQGFVSQRSFSITKSEHYGDTNAVDDIELSNISKLGDGEEENASCDKDQANTTDFLLTLISRRSIKRAGLRYLRRGVDDEGNVANNVETEQILSSQTWNMADKIFSLTQVRGSIPLFFSQSPYSFKPTPVMLGSEASNKAAFAKHFSKVAERYGSVQAVSLIDKHGTEVGIGELYEKHASSLNTAGGINGSPFSFEWFDFHGVCKGMNFKNVSILLETLQQNLQSFGWHVSKNGETVRAQTGVIRTNCMDCLDRTNVVQSAVAGWALEKQLAELGLEIDLQTDMKTQWFNVLWADNGDAISKQYAGTSALKGDFTRTRKRNWTGALSDFSLTLNRYYNNIFGDYFLQTCIDYYLGNAGPAIFDEFESDMMAQDYALDMRNVRRNAIDTCIKIVLEDPKEHLIAGWALSCPNEANTLRSLPFEECVLLLTDAALYFCRFDWTTEKVGSFERVDLLDISEIWRGSYVTSALGPTHLDETKNVGFVVKFSSNGPAFVRTNTRSLANEEAATERTTDNGIESNNDSAHTHSKNTTVSPTSRILAFKALPPKAMASKRGGEEDNFKGEIDTTKDICAEIENAILTVTTRDQGGEGADTSKVVVEERSIISAAEARKNTGYVETLGYSLKRLVWA